MHVREREPHAALRQFVDCSAATRLVRDAHRCAEPIARCFTFTVHVKLPLPNAVRDTYSSALLAFFFASAAAVASALYVYMASLKKEGLCS